ncbi:phospholipid:diacylglycerol acyltransferase [Lentinula boryana]|uniref:Phospholipid:diacylglycerol acyltransferase n=1 Tax=Lentinula boryana TaxID=40481 RepID=A0ABQ8QJZ8_9AGAR|nr:phospholipid:diacylglycerol acyltransferase [Lentinula boryana]
MALRDRFKRTIRIQDIDEDPNPENSISNSPASESSDPVKLELWNKKHSLQKEVDQLKRKHESSVLATRKFLFPLGVLLGILLAFAFVQPSDIQDMHAQLTLLMDQYDLTLPQLPDFDFSRFETEWNKLRSNIPELWKFNRDGREFQVGERMKARGLSAEYPVVLIPGVISTGLESWSTSPEYRPFFREKLWGGLNMLSQVTFNRDKWIAAMMLDPVTGLDPPDAKIRAAEGIDAASSFIQGYWIWSKIVENLAVVNYDTNNLHLAPYDWRLSYWNLEERDGYFSKLKTTIEGFKRRQKRKTVVAAHSMGANVRYFLEEADSLTGFLIAFLFSIDFSGTDSMFNFNASWTLTSLSYCLILKWVESPRHGGGGPDWVENHIEAYISIAGTHLGVAKAMAAFLSGEMKDTVQMNPAGSYVLERFFSRAERRKLFLSWAGSASMWIKGGDAIWGNSTFAPDDPSEDFDHEIDANDVRKRRSGHTHGELISFRHIPVSTPRQEGEMDPQTNFRLLNEDNGAGVKNMTSEMAGEWILEHTPSSFQKMMATNYSFGMERDEEALKRNDLDHTKWTNPLEVKLPNAPSMKMFCVYGHGKETERSYWYTRGDYEYDETAADGIAPLCRDPNPGSNQIGTCAGLSPRNQLDMPLLRKSWIDADYTDATANPKVRNGVKMGEGDGTVSLISLGAMCVEGWKRRRWNPAGINVTVVELPHRPVPSMPRGGANTSDHVDVLGSTALNEIIVKVATGAGHEVEEMFVSNIKAYARRIEWD